MKKYEKNEMTLSVGIMIGIIVVAYIFLWATVQSTEERMEQLDPQSYDMEAICTEKTGHYLICNEGKDRMYVYDDVEVYIKQIDTVVKENGDLVTSVTYLASSIQELERTIDANQQVPLLLWLTKQGQIDVIMMVETTFTSYDLADYGKNVTKLWDKSLYLMKSVFYDKISSDE